MERRVALVTGGSRGIGRAICLELAKHGYDVGVNYASRKDAAEEVVEQIASLGGEAVALGGSIASSDDRKRLIENIVERFSRLDLLVNNAGITSPGRLDVLEATEENFDTVVNTNLKGPFFLSQLAANEMIRLKAAGKIPGGKIVTTTSISAYAVSTNRADYCLTKAGLSMMTKLYAQRLGDEGILVYEVCPGVIETDMTSSPSVKEKYDRLIADGIWPVRRWGKPEDVAKAVAAIAADYFPFTTGSRFDVDGGFHIRSL